MRRIIITLTLMLASALGFTALTAGAQTSPPPRVSVGISIDQRSGAPTETTIDCGKDGRFSTVNGDGTLFMENREPHKMLCQITIRRVGTLT